MFGLAAIWVLQSGLACSGADDLVVPGPFEDEDEDEESTTTPLPSSTADTARGPKDTSPADTGGLEPDVLSVSYALYLQDDQKCLGRVSLPRNDDPLPLWTWDWPHGLGGNVYTFSASADSTELFLHATRTLAGASETTMQATTIGVGSTIVYAFAEPATTGYTMVLTVEGFTAKAKPPSRECPHEQGT